MTEKLNLTIEKVVNSANDTLKNKWNFNIGWKFKKADIPGADKPAFNDSDWETVSAPHTFNDIDTFDNYMEGGHNGERNMFTGKTWYRKYFKLNKEDEDKKIFIEFEGVRQAADVYINGKKLEGKYENGFIPFGFDLTPYVTFGDTENVLAIMVDNTFPYKTEETGDILSWHDSHWHPTHGGIYRNVYLHIKDKLHITLPLYSFLKTQGTYVYATDIKEDSADVHVEAEVINGHDTSKTTDFVTEVLDRDGNVVLTMNESRELASGEKVIFHTAGHLTDIHRWFPVHPYVYTVRSKLVVDEEVVDTQETPFGIRTFEFTNNQGFFINGQPLKLQGWGQRPTNEWAGLGAAYPNWMHGFIFQQMKDAGGNFIRWGHSAGAPVDVELADKYGLITVQPGVDGEGSTVGGVYSDVSYTIRANAYRDMIIYYRNHPSILVWEGGNQSVPEQEAQTLKNMTDTWDPHGNRAYAHRRCNLTMSDYVDVSIGTEGSWELKSKGKPVIEGEYNREEAARRVWDRFTPGYEDYETAAGSAYNLTSEEFARNQAKHYEKISHPAHGGGANWIFSDSTSHGRVYSEVSRVSGVVDGVMLPKEAYFSLKAIYRNDPQVHLIGHWNYPKGTVKDVYVMANAPKVELFINGNSQGFGALSHDYLFTFENIIWEPGTVKAVAYDEEGNTVAEQVKKTAGDPVSVKLSVITGPNGFRANGSDVVLIDAEAIDGDGNRCPTFEGRIDFQVEGPAIYRGGYNSGKEHSTNNPYLDLEAGVNRVAIRSTQTPGLVNVTAKVAGLQSDSVEIEAKPVAVWNGLTEEMPVVPGITLGEEPPVGEGPDPNLKLTDEENAGPTLINDFSYSGIAVPGGVKGNAHIGALIFSDEEDEFPYLPNHLIGSEYIQVPNEDRNYKALDLMHFSVEQQTEVWIAHDDLLERPEWLIEEYEETESKLFVKNHSHTLFKKTVDAGTALTLGGNQDETNVKDCNMYVVFAKKQQN
ncbi:glycoside hydrolase family 2 protein [Oceanobacillus halophilus]|uniref:Glycoside hydrolase family 2 protein n=1 Tax=Oceanobacillus halophilus TaxID=930130 RepID=A0A495A487_9BACI|nr:sugar-binding domain-containing protein [Oceanobacillus halophilus]RKQ34327.1 glycoside hydrolase family 2 protein [Oceanobacillus halophilus]